MYGLILGTTGHTDIKQKEYLTQKQINLNLCRKTKQNKQKGRKMKKGKIINIRLSEELLNKVKTIAKEQFRNLTDQARMYIEQGVKRDEKSKK